MTVAPSPIGLYLVALVQPAIAPNIPPKSTRWRELVCTGPARAPFSVTGFARGEFTAAEGLEPSFVNPPQRMWLGSGVSAFAEPHSPCLHVCTIRNMDVWRADVLDMWQDLNLTFDTRIGQVQSDFTTSVLSLIDPETLRNTLFRLVRELPPTVSLMQPEIPA